MLYSGTLGLKHDTAVFGALHRALHARMDDVRLAVVSEGHAADRLASQSPEITVLPFQDFSVLPDVLGSADLLLTILEAEASDYSVPSKTLSYLCAGRPVLALLPCQQPGVPHRPGRRQPRVRPDRRATTTRSRDAVVDLLKDPDRARTGVAPRRATYAEREFDIDRITSVFEQVLQQAITA